MKSINLILGCHAHQPVGNFGFVFEEAYDKSYLPFVELLQKYPAVKVTLHYTGPLWDWFEEHRPEFIDRLRGLAASGQVEIMGGAYYEPLLCAIPERDAVAQIRRMNEYCAHRFGEAPKGMWLAERVWEPHMARILAEGGIGYAALDDSHFLASGLDRDELFGYYMTEDEGRAVRVFPIHERLRYTIPFHPVEDTIAYLREHATEDGRRCAVFHDDSEKFGVWPGTYKSVYEEGWLERFFVALTENQDWIRCATYSSYVEENPALGRTYITCASYSEMMGWALPTRMQKRLHAIERELHDNPEMDAKLGVFVRGGFWRNFLAKYDESNNLQKRMLLASNRLDALKRRGAQGLDEAEKLLHQGQCNCAYWHGVFGGLYLNHLRTAIYEQVIAAEVAMDAIERPGESWCEMRVLDVDGDGREEVVVDSATSTWLFAPSDGGTLVEWDYKPRPFNVMNVLTRREEEYHAKLQDAETVHADGHEGATSIHDILHVKESGLQHLLCYDRYRRVSLRDRCFPLNTPVAALWRDSYTELSTLPAALYAVEQDDAGFRMHAASVVSGPVDGHITVSKRIMPHPTASSMKVHYLVENVGSTELRFQFGMDWAVNFLTGSAHDRYYASDDRDLGRQMLGAREEDNGLSHIALCDDYTGLCFALRMSVPATIYRFPLETVSQSEGGQERVYQGSIVLPSWELDLAPSGVFEVELQAETRALHER